ncbi:MAG TPA: S8 family serine peptidase [Solirubrobacteraceae bacterium]|nr:S8 family serine peptidase [Solirubrobacteraceae bacterium]
MLGAIALSGLPGEPSPGPAAAAQIADASTPAHAPVESIAAAYDPTRIVVKYAPDDHAARASSAPASGAGEPADEASTTHLLNVPASAELDSTLAKLRGEKGVVWAVPDYVAHATSISIPDDPGTTGSTPGDWKQVQWNFDGTFGVDASQAWANVAADGAPGGSKVIVAVLDTGVAYANRGKYRRSPDFNKYSFVQGYDFIDRTPYANDHNGHGTFVAGTIAEATNNHYGLTGLAYAARIMPVRVLDSAGEGDASVIAEGVRFAVNHGARIINLSLEFSSDVGASDIPELIEALRYAYRHNVLVVAAAGNEGSTSIPYPARAGHVIAVGATTEHGCLASYSNDGRGITLVAPGGGPDASLPGDPNCNPELPSGRDIFQMTFTGSSPRVFGFPDGYEGTSMATPHVSATAALVIAAHILGRKPTVAQLTTRLTATARKLGGPQDQALYGAGLLDAGAATAPGGPGAVG